VAKGVCTKEPHLLERAVKLLELSPMTARQRVLALLSQRLDFDGVCEVRALVVDLVVSMQEVRLDSKASQSSSKDSLDELGCLLELVTGEFDLVSCQLKLGHIVRVWLQQPKQAVLLYQGALETCLQQSRSKQVSFKALVDDEELTEEVKMQLS
jgi:hypothetical protein